MRHGQLRTGAWILVVIGALGGAMGYQDDSPSGPGRSPAHGDAGPPRTGALSVHWAVTHDASARLVPGATVVGHAPRDGNGLSTPDESPRGVLASAEGGGDQQGGAPPVPAMVTPPGSRSVEQTTLGARQPATAVASFDGLGVGFSGPQGSASGRNPSDNSLAVGPDHVVQIVNTRMAIFTKRGARFDTTGRVLYGPVPTNNVFRGFGGPCEERNNGDAVVRYDQLANRWLIVMPIFSRGPARPDQPVPRRAGDPAARSEAGRPGQPGAATRLYEPPPPPPESAGTGRAGRGRGEAQPQGTYSMCYAVSVGADPFGPYYRYEFVRPLFPDYPRPAVWPDGYYLPTSTGDDVIQKHACVADRARMLRGVAASEQCLVIDGVNFLNNADLDGTALPPAGAPNIIMAAGGTQLHRVFEDSVLYAWTFHVDWSDPRRTRVEGPVTIPVAPYHYLCDGQLSSCVPQPGTDRRLDAQGDKIMARLVYRRVGGHESLVAVHSVNTSAGAGGVRWYEFRLGRDRRRDPLPAGHLRPGQRVPLDGESRHRSIREHRDRLLVWGLTALRRAALCRAHRGRSEGRAHASRGGAGRGRGGAGQHAALGGLHADRHRPVGRLHHLVRGRLRPA